jgi:hypothetical protein
MKQKVPQAAAAAPWPDEQQHAVLKSYYRDRFTNFTHKRAVPTISSERTSIYRLKEWTETRKVAEDLSTL